MARSSSIFNTRYAATRKDKQVNSEEGYLDIDAIGKRPTLSSPAIGGVTYEQRSIDAACMQLKFFCKDYDLLEPYDPMIEHFKMLTLIRKLFIAIDRGANLDAIRQSMKPMQELGEKALQKLREDTSPGRNISKNLQLFKKEFDEELAARSLESKPAFSLNPL